MVVAIVVVAVAALAVVWIRAARRRVEREAPIEPPIVEGPVAPHPVAPPARNDAASFEQLLAGEPRAPSDATIDRVSDEIIAWIEARRGETDGASWTPPAPSPDEFAQNAPTISDHDPYALVRFSTVIRRGRARN